MELNEREKQKLKYKHSWQYKVERESAMELGLSAEEDTFTALSAMFLPTGEHQEKHGKTITEHNKMKFKINL